MVDGREGGSWRVGREGGGCKGGRMVVVERSVKMEDRETRWMV